jgi:hypothetical protein
MAPEQGAEMYKRQVLAGLFTALLTVVFSTVIAIVNPFDVKGWVVWTVLSTGGIVSVFGGIVAVIFNHDESDKDYFGNLAGIALFGAFVVAIIVGASFTGVQSKYVGLFWATYAFMIVSFILTGLVGYLAKEDPAPSERHLRRAS